MKKDRITGLDFLRGVCLVGMILVHFVFDLQYFGGISLEVPFWFEFLGDRGHLLFILLSGICVTLGSHPFQRGLTVFGCGLLVSYVTLFTDLILHWENSRVWFGILHLLGASMMLYPLFRDLNALSLAVLGFLLSAAGIYLSRIYVAIPWLFPLGFCSRQVYPGSDFFPLLPNLGYFLVGTAAGKLLYPEKRQHFSFLSNRGRILQWLGQHSLAIYLLHQPILIFIVWLLT